MSPFMAFKVQEKDMAVPFIPNLLEMVLCCSFLPLPSILKAGQPPKTISWTPLLCTSRCSLLSRCILPCVFVEVIVRVGPHLLPLTCELWWSSIPCPIYIFFLHQATGTPVPVRLRGVCPKKWSQVTKRHILDKGLAKGSYCHKLDRSRANRTWQRKAETHTWARSQKNLGRISTHKLVFLKCWWKKDYMLPLVTKKVPWPILKDSKLHFLFLISVSSMAIGVALLILAALVANVNSKLRLCIM